LQHLEQHQERLSDLLPKNRSTNYVRFAEKNEGHHQYFCGEEYYRHGLPIDPSLLGRWRKRVGEQGSELILKLTVQAGLASGAVDPASLERIIVDTTVQEKAVAFPTDSRLHNRSCERSVKLAATWGISLRQSYSRLGR